MPLPRRGRRISWLPWSLTVLELSAAGGSGPVVAGVRNFLAPFLPSLFGSFGLPDRLTDADLVIQTVAS